MGALDGVRIVRVEDDGSREALRLVLEARGGRTPPVDPDKPVDVLVGLVRLTRTRP